jgi:hypothetical protein
MASQVMEKPKQVDVDKMFTHSYIFLPLLVDSNFMLVDRTDPRRTPEKKYHTHAFLSERITPAIISENKERVPKDASELVSHSASIRLINPKRLVSICLGCFLRDLEYQTPVLEFDLEEPSNTRYQLCAFPYYQRVIANIEQVVESKCPKCITVYQNTGRIAEAGFLFNPALRYRHESPVIGLLDSPPSHWKYHAERDWIYAAYWRPSEDSLWQPPVGVFKRERYNFESVMDSMAAIALYNDSKEVRALLFRILKRYAVMCVRSHRDCQVQVDSTDGKKYSASGYMANRINNLVIDHAGWAIKERFVVEHLARCWPFRSTEFSVAECLQQVTTYAELGIRELHTAEYRVQKVVDKVLSITTPPATDSHDAHEKFEMDVKRICVNHFVPDWKAIVRLCCERWYALTTFYATPSTFDAPFRLQETGSPSMMRGGVDLNLWEHRRVEPFRSRSRSQNYPSAENLDLNREWSSDSSTLVDVCYVTSPLIFSENEVEMKILHVFALDQEKFDHIVTKTQIERSDTLPSEKELPYWPMHPLAPRPSDPKDYEEKDMFFNAGDDGIALGGSLVPVSKVESAGIDGAYNQQSSFSIDKSRSGLLRIDVHFEGVDSEIEQRGDFKIPKSSKCNVAERFGMPPVTIFASFVDSKHDEEHVDIFLPLLDYRPTIYNAVVLPFLTEYGLSEFITGVNSALVQNSQPSVLAVLMQTADDYFTSIYDTQFDAFAEHKIYATFGREYTNALYQLAVWKGEYLLTVLMDLATFVARGSDTSEITAKLTDVLIRPIVAGVEFDADGVKSFWDKFVALVSEAAGQLYPQLDKDKQITEEQLLTIATRMFPKYRKIERELRIGRLQLADNAKEEALSDKTHYVVTDHWKFIPTSRLTTIYNLFEKLREHIRAFISANERWYMQQFTLLHSTALRLADRGGYQSYRLQFNLNPAWSVENITEDTLIDKNHEVGANGTRFHTFVYDVYLAPLVYGIVFDTTVYFGQNPDDNTPLDGKSLKALYRARYGNALLLE